MNDQREPLRLHLGGEQAKSGWKIVNALPGPLVDYVGNVTDLSQFQAGTVDEIYASHVYEHLNYVGEAQAAVAEAFRVLRPGGSLKVSVPDLETLCRMFIAPGAPFADRAFIMRMLMGGQSNPYDYHKVMFDYELLRTLLAQKGFTRIERVKGFGLFKDTSEMIFGGVPISLNVQAFKP